MRVCSLLLACAAVMAPCATAQGTGAIPPGSMQDMLRPMIFDALKTDPAEDKGGMLRQMYSLAGREDLAAKQKPPSCVALPDDPVAAIVARARDTNIVIINEDHASPFDRHFVGRVLTALKAEGYAVYAAETFMPGRDLAEGEVMSDDGFYVNEPIYARTVQLAKTLGYKLVAYESVREQDEEIQQANPDLSQINRREMAQVENLMNAIFNEQPDAKVLIHVGHAHVWERGRPESKGSEVWMAERLKARTGRDPLTIDQTWCASTSGASVAAVSLTKADGTIAPVQMVDLFVGHAPLEFRDGRVAWRQELGERIVAMPGELAGKQEHVIVEARPEGAARDVVPTDRILQRPGETIPLLLPPGRYRVEGFTAAGMIEGVAPVVEAH